jgi:hypothetical protein
VVPEKAFRLGDARRTRKPNFLLLKGPHCLACTSRFVWLTARQAHSKHVRSMQHTQVRGELRGAGSVASTVPWLAWTGLCYVVQRNRQRDLVSRMQEFLGTVPTEDLKLVLCIYY